MNHKPCSTTLIYPWFAHCELCLSTVEFAMTVAMTKRLQRIGDQELPCTSTRRSLMSAKPSMKKLRVTFRCRRCADSTALPLREGDTRRSVMLRKIWGILWRKVQWKVECTSIYVKWMYLVLRYHFVWSKTIKLKFCDRSRSFGNCEIPSMLNWCVEIPINWSFRHRDKWVQLQWSQTLINYW